jgi:hypothetical protein
MIAEIDWRAMRGDATPRRRHADEPYGRDRAVPVGPRPHEKVARSFRDDDVEERVTAPSLGYERPQRSRREEITMKYLLLKHYRGAPSAVNDHPMHEWTPEEVDAHIAYMNAFADRLRGSGEFVSGEALAPEGMWVRHDGLGKPPVTDGPFAESKDLIAGWMVIDVEDEARAIELAGELSAAPGYGGEPIHEWLELRPFLTHLETVTEG